MGYYDDINAGHKEKVERSRKPWFTSIVSGIIGGAMVLGVTTFTDLNQNATTNQGSEVTLTEERENSAEVGAQPLSSTNEIADIVENLSPAIVGITNIQASANQFQNAQGVESGTGSGVIFKKSDDAAYIITNNHVIEGAQSVEVTHFNGEKVKASVVGADPLTDMAVLKIGSEHVTTVASFGDSSALRTGESVIAIGNPLGLEFSRTVTEGIISGKDRSVNITTSDGDWALDVIQTDAAINPGNSGGPLINMSGEVIGINSLKISQNGVEGLGFAIPSEDVVPISEELMEKGKIKRPFLGVGLIDLAELPEAYVRDTMNLPKDIKAGVVVGNIAPSSPADSAGLKEQDVIVSMNGTEIKGASDLRKYLYNEAKIGDEIDVKVYRTGKAVTVKIQLSERDATGA